MRRGRSISTARILLWNGFGWDGCAHFSRHFWKWWA